MAGIDTPSCEHSSMYQVPREIWLKILDYIPMTERLQQVQFVCQLFQSFCSGAGLTEKIDFKDCVYMPDDLCVRTVKNNENFVRYLSFRRCYWFSSAMYTKFPTLNGLVTLDLTDIHLYASQWISMFQKTPVLQNLSLTIMWDTMLELNSYMDRADRKLQLKIFHADVLLEEQQRKSVKLLQLEIQHLDKFIKSCCHEEAYSVSIPKYLEPSIQSNVDLATDKTGLRSNWAIYNRGSIDVDDDSVVTNIRNMLKQNGLHCVQLDSDKKHKLDNIRYMSLPSLFFCDDAVRPCVCDGLSFTSSLPALQYLSITPLAEGDHFQCFTDTVTGILCECDMPKLTHLLLSDESTENARVPVKFYQRLGTFMNLIELNLKGIYVIMLPFLEATKDLKNLQGLALSLNYSILQYDIPCSHEQVVPDRRMSFFNRLVTTFPNLKKLELLRNHEYGITTDTEDLIPISSLAKLEHLMIGDLKLKNTFYFEQICRNSQNIKSLKVCAGPSEVWECVNLNEHLHYMQQLTEIHLFHPNLPIIETLQHLRGCKQLRTIFILGKSRDCGGYQDNIAVEDVTGAFDALLKECKLICGLHIICEGANDTIRMAVDECKRDMLSKGRMVIIIYYCCEDYVDVALSDSNVATCTPFDFFVGE